MSNVSIFESNAALPAFLADFMPEENNDLIAHASESIPVISIRGKVFTIIKEGKSAVVPNPRDPESPASYINVIIVKANPFNSKAYYDVAYDSSAQDQKPCCFSSNGKTPDPASEKPQCETCRACRWNQFNTARNADGTTGKGKACADHVRVALCTPSNFDDAYLLRIPPASIKNFGALGKELASHHVPYQACIVRVSFDPKEATPRLVFKPVDTLKTKEDYDKVKELAETELVKHMLGDAMPAEANVDTGVPARHAYADLSGDRRQAKNEAADRIIEKVMEEPKEEPKPTSTTTAKVASADATLGDILSDLGL